MNEDLGLDDESLPPSLVLHVDRICSRFEQAWRGGQQPLVEQYLDDTPEPGRSVLLRELRAVADAYGSAPAEAALSTDTSGAPQGQRATRVAPLPRPTIKGYEVLEQAGQGAMGVVYRARQLSLQRVVALKIGQRGGSGWARFQQEAEAIARLEHPHIVRIYDYGECNGLPYFSMEWVDGGDLARWMAREHATPQSAADLVAKLADAIHFAHQRGVVHRDLKPANILLVSGGVVSGEWSKAPLTTHQPKIADFGLAKCVDRDSGLTDSEQVLGTVRYMAPEQAGGKTHAVGPRSDIFALGAILYELMTGQPPFRADTWLETLDQVRFQAPARPSRLRADIPDELEAICLRCLEKDPTRRYPSAQALSDDLRRFLGQGNRQIAPEFTPLLRLRRLFRSKVLTAGMLATLGLCVLAGIGLTRWLPATTEPTTVAATVPATVQIQEFRISHHRGEQGTFLGYLGSVSFAARCNDDVRVQVKLSRAAHCFLVAFNPDGSEQLCSPSNPNLPPTASTDLTYPASPSRYFGLTDGTGLQVFVLIASVDPLPAYSAWRPKLGSVSWQSVDCSSVWRFDGQQLTWLGEERGTERQRGGPPTRLQELVDCCQGASGVDAVQALAFPVKPKE